MTCCPYPTFIRLLRTRADVVDLGEGFAEVAGRGTAVVMTWGSGLDLNGAVGAGGTDELANRRNA